MGGEALNGHVEVMMEYGEKIPQPSSLEGVMRDENNRTGVAILVEAKVKTAPVRVNITIDKDLLHQIDAITHNRSAFLAEAARKALGQLY